jgi:hypothetical protein
MEGMDTIMTILARYKENTKRQFLSFVSQKPRIPDHVTIPMDGLAALQLGIWLGRQEGYGEGLVMGAKLGMDVGSDVMNLVLSQPVISGPLLASSVTDQQ